MLLRVLAGRRVITAGQSLNRPSSPVLRYDEALSGPRRLKRYRYALRLLISSSCNKIIFKYDHYENICLIDERECEQTSVAGDGQVDAGMVALRLARARPGAVPGGRRRSPSPWRGCKHLLMSKDG